MDDFKYTTITCLLVLMAVGFQQPWIFLGVGLVILYALWRNFYRYYFWSYLVILSFYGCYSLFGIEPLFAPLWLKAGKDVVWLAFLLIGLWKFRNDIKKVLRVNDQLIGLVVLFIGYILLHALFLRTGLSERILEVRYYLSYLPLLFLPLIGIKNFEILKKNLTELCILGLFVALFALMQDKIPGVSVLGGYRVNSTLPNFFHMSMYLNAIICLATAFFTIKLKDKFEWTWFVGLLIYIFLLTFVSLHSDSRGSMLSLYVSLTLLVVVLMLKSRIAIWCLIASITAGLVFFTLGPSWATSRYVSFFQQIGGDVLVTIKGEKGVEERQNIKLKDFVNDETISSEQKEYAESHSADRSVVQRVVKFQAGLDLIEKNLFFGTGLNLTNGNLNTAFASDMFFLDVIVHIGVVGFLIFISLVLFLICLYSFMAWKLINRNKEQGFMLISVAAIMIQYMISALTTSSWIAFPVNALFWLFAGFGLYIIEQKSDKT